MDTTGNIQEIGGFSMRRTVLTLLGAVAAFGILTASYATAELPATSPIAVEAAVLD